MYGISSSFWTADDRLREGQQPGADLQMGVLCRSQIDFEAHLVVLQKEANRSPLLHKMFRLRVQPFLAALPSVARGNFLSAMAINVVPRFVDTPSSPHGGRAHRIPNLDASTGHNLFVFSVLVRCGFQGIS